MDLDEKKIFFVISPHINYYPSSRGDSLGELDNLITKRVTLEEIVNVFKYYDREKWIKIIVEPQKK